MELNNPTRREVNFHPKPQPGDDMELNNPTRSVTMIVWGYDKSLSEDNIKSLLSEHFSSCGEITKVHIHAHAQSKIHNKYAFVDIAGVGAKEKALQLNGSDVGGHKVLVKALPWTRYGKFTPLRAVMWSELNERSRQGPRMDVVLVSGYDTWLPEESVRSALSEHFSSCGGIDGVTIAKEKDGSLHKTAAIHIWGEGIAEKARALSGSDMGGWKAVVEHCSEPRDGEVNGSLHMGRRRQAKMTRE
ncbi:unnamed protein product [Arabis nemorensis]|uniref:RRM domain-containing protein n=1 Tax=Arabis nemorensis TaxID=586526 RepID=A0A565B5D5_9BRAS|nr:unnamed protein product [Arabis nemorensis]